MPAIIFVIGLIIGLFVIYRFYQRHRIKTRTRSLIDQQLMHIRNNEILLKPDPLPHTFSGKFAGRLFRFSFGAQLSLLADLTVDLADNQLWIYPVNHPFKSDKFKSNLERNRAWSSKQQFDSVYYVAGKPRHFAFAVIHGAHRVQDRLLNNPGTVIRANGSHIVCYPHRRDTHNLTTEDWYTLMSLTSDLADRIEDIFEPEMFSGIEVNEHDYPPHSGGHVN